MTGTSPLAALLITAALIALSAFFVAIEFALVAARCHRLEEAAAASAAARAALRSSRDLSLLLAGSQLGITLCTLGLGAVAKPAVHDLLTPLLHSWGLPAVTADVIAFIAALTAVTFLHLVVGEMAPKSWAIAHPERSATLLALPMRAFMTLTRPVLVALNSLANWCLHRVGVDAVDELATGRNPATLRELVDHSAEAGTLDQHHRRQLLAAMEADTAALRTIVRADADISGVALTDAVDRIQAVARDSGHLRLVVWRDGQPIGVVHVRDTLDRDVRTTAADIMRPVLALPADQPVYDALTTLRQHRCQVALVQDNVNRAGRADRVAILGLVTMHDMLATLMPGAGIRARDDEAADSEAADDEKSDDRRGVQGPRRGDAL